MAESQYYEEVDQNEVDKETYASMEKMYGKGDAVRTLHHKYTKNGVVATSDHKPVKEDETIFDVPAAWEKLSTTKKAVARGNLGQTNTGIFRKEVVEFKHAAHEPGTTLHDQSADKYFQAVVEFFADEEKSEAEQTAVKDAVTALKNSIGVLNPKHRYLATRNLSRCLNEKAQVMEYEQAVKNRQLFDSNDVLDAQIADQFKELEELLTEFRVDLKKIERMEKDSTAKSDINRKNEELVTTKAKILSVVEDINNLHHQRKLAGKIHQPDYDADRAAFYTFRNDDNIGVYELFRNRADNEQYCLQQFKAAKGCTNAKGFGKDKFNDRRHALDAAIEDLKSDLRQDKFKNVNYFTCHFHTTSGYQQTYLAGKYFHLSPRVQSTLGTIQPITSSSSAGDKKRQATQSLRKSKRSKHVAANKKKKVADLA
jgi:hypothetical protein